MSLGLLAIWIVSWPLIFFPHPAPPVPVYEIVRAAPIQHELSRPLANSWHYRKPSGRRHNGVDVFAPLYSTVAAIESGKIVWSNNSLGGKCIWLLGDSGRAYYYAHLSWRDPDVRGKHVQAGTRIGEVGNTGNARGGPYHVHLELHPNGRGSKAVSPWKLLLDLYDGTTPDNELRRVN